MKCHCIKIKSECIVLHSMSIKCIFFKKSNNEIIKIYMLHKYKKERNKFVNYLLLRTYKLINYLLTKNVKIINL